MPKYVVRVERIVQNSDRFEVDMPAFNMEELRAEILRRVQEDQIPWKDIEGDEQVKAFYYPSSDTGTGVPGMGPPL